MGFIKVDRNLKDWQWFAKENMLLVWMYLLTSAYYKDGYFEGVEIKKGQVPIGRKSMAEKLHISEQQARTCINRLKSTGEITTTSTNKFTIITIVKWADYQYIPEYINQRNNQDVNQQSTNEQPTSNQQSTTIKELKEQIELKESLFNNINPDEIEPKKSIEEMSCDELQDEILNQENWVDQVNIFETYETEFARPITQTELMRLAEWKETYGHRLVLYALRESVIYGKRSFDYIDKVLMNWKNNGFTEKDYEEGKR